MKAISKQPSRPKMNLHSSTVAPAYTGSDAGNLQIDAPKPGKHFRNLDSDQKLLDRLQKAVTHRRSKVDWEVLGSQAGSLGTRYVETEMELKGIIRTEQRRTQKYQHRWAITRMAHKSYKKFAHAKGCSNERLDAAAARKNASYLLREFSQLPETIKERVLQKEMDKNVPVNPTPAHKFNSESGSESSVAPMQEENPIKKFRIIGSKTDLEIDVTPQPRALVDRGVQNRSHVDKIWIEASSESSEP